MQRAEVGFARRTLARYLPLVVALGACGPQAPASDPSTEPAPPPAAAAAPAELAPSLTPAPAPANIVAKARIRSLNATLATLTEWTGHDLTAFPALAVASRGAAALLPVLDWNAPIDVVATLDDRVRSSPRALFAVSFGLSSRTEALDALGQTELTVEMVEPMVHAFRPNEDMECFVAAALGTAPARLVCSDSREGLDVLAPHLTRGTPSTSAPEADVQLELLAESAWQLFGEKAKFLRVGVPVALQKIATGDPALDAAVKNAALSLTDQLIHGLSELDLLDLQLKLDRNRSEARLALNVQLRGESSWLSRWFVEQRPHQAVAPPRFWQLPGNAEHAGFYHLARTPAAEELWDGSMPIVEAALSHLGTTPAVAKQTLEISRQLSAPTGAGVWAGFPLDELDEKELATASEARQRIRRSLGVQVSSHPSPGTPLEDRVQAMLVLFNDDGFRKGGGALMDQLLHTEKLFGTKSGPLSKLQHKRGTPQFPKAELITATLPANMLQSLEELDDKTAKPKGARSKPGQPLEIVMLFLQRDGLDYYCTSTSVASAERALQEVLSNPSGKPTLGQRPELAAFRSEPALLSYFTSIAALAQEHREMAEALGDQRDNPAWAAPLRVSSYTMPEAIGGGTSLSVPRSVIHAIGQLIAPASEN